MAEEQKPTKVDVEAPAVLAPATTEPTPAPVEVSKDVAEEKIHNPPPPVESKALAVVESKLSIYTYIRVVWLLLCYMIIFYL